MSTVVDIRRLKVNEGLVTNNLSHGMAFGERGSMCFQNVGSLQHYVVSISRRTWFALCK